MKIDEIMKGRNACTQLVFEYQRQHGRSVIVRVKPWWFPFKRACTSTPGRVWWSPHRTYSRPEEALPTMAHEIQHDIDVHNTNIVWWVLRYTFPQCLAVLGFLGLLGLVTHPVFYAMFLFFLFAPPWPAPGRIDAEVRGYAVSTYTRSKLHMSLPDYAPVLVRLSPYYYPAWKEEPVNRGIRYYLGVRTQAMELVDDVLNTS